ncbi:MAG TPA: class I SAM-dependent methyltransferase [Ignavibacteriaceae bacterium]|nr:class I SAM-dependent methyltransferase [Ignavibacteriaceae bacterium]
MNNYLKTNYDLNDKETVSVIDELPLWSAPFGLKLLDKINYRKNITALDIGSGLGFPLLEVAMRLGNTCKVYGIDPWKAAVERIKTKIRIYGVTNVEIITGVAENIPLPDNSVDLIFSNNGLNNVNDIKMVLNECRRISKIGSQLLFTYNTDKTMQEFYSVFEKLLRERKMLTEIESMKKHIYKKRLPVEVFIQLLNASGYSINEISHDEFAYRFVDGTALINHFLIKLAFIDSWKEFIPKEKQTGFFAELVDRLNQLAQSNGLLNLTIPFVLIDCEKTRE